MRKSEITLTVEHAGDVANEYDVIRAMNVRLAERGRGPLDAHPGAAQLHDVSLMGRLTLRGVTVEPSPLVGGGILVDGRRHYGPAAIFEVVPVVAPEPEPAPVPAPPADPYEGKSVRVQFNGSSEIWTIQSWCRSEAFGHAPTLLKRLRRDPLNVQSSDVGVADVVDWLQRHPEVPILHTIYDSTDDIPF